MEAQQPRYATPTLLALVFFSGFANLATEIIGPRLFASLFGTTTIIWAVIISVTLGGLAWGYAMGGRIPRERAPAILPLILIANAVWLLLVSWIVWLLPASIAAANVRVDLTVIVITVLAAFLVPSLLFGMVSPVAITLFSFGRTAEAMSRVAGNVFALSTIGSVLGALAAAFVFIPYVGLSTSLQLFAAGLLGFAAWVWVGPGRWRIGAVMVLVFVLPQPDYHWQQDDDLRLLAQREGLYQTIRVYTDDETFVQMHLGPTFHSRVDLETGEPLFSYAEKMLQRAGDVAGKRAVVIGGAGHGLSHWLENRGAQVIEVEIDPFVVQLSDAYFGPIEGEVIIEDGRIYLARLPDNSVDLVLVDAFDGAGNVPPQLTTLEFFEDVERVLTPQGRMLYNFIGTPEGSRSGAFEAMSATLQAAFPGAGASNYEGTESQNIILIGSPAPLNDIPHVDLPAGGTIITDNHNPIDLLLSMARSFIYFRY